jgi:nucleotide-binding universal stress UspA family protein
MKKFLAVFDGYRLSKSTLAYAQELAIGADAHLTGLFLDDFLYHSYNVSEVFRNYDEPEVLVKKLNAVDRRERDKAVIQFTESCKKAKVDYSVCRDKSMAILELEHESMFADLIIINENETFARTTHKPPTPFMKELLANVQCPVLVVPDRYRKIGKIILLYDGGPSSMHAIKMFSYLLCNFRNLPVQVYTAKDGMKHPFQFPDGPLLKEFARRHFPNAKCATAKGTVEKLIISYLKRHGKNVLVVLGAYRRSGFSRWFKTSMADVLMMELDIPLFVAHNK